MIANLDGHTVTHAKLWVPAWGLPWAEVSLDEEVTLSGQVTLTIADLTQLVTVVSGGPNVGRSHYRLVGGHGGWGRTIAEKNYVNDAGVKLSTVLGDAATAAGERFAEALPTTRIGTAWVRESGPAALALEHLATAAWYVDPEGLTRLGARAATTLAAEYTASRVDLANGSTTLAADSIAGIVPGLSVEGLTVADVMHELTPQALRSHVWGANASGGSRRVRALKSMLAQLLPDLRFRGVYEYRIATQDGERVNLQPVRTSIGLPYLPRVRVTPGIPGASASHYLGARVLVAFVNADPSRPVVVSFEDAEGPGFVPTLLKLSGGGAGVARLGDAVDCGYLVANNAKDIYWRLSPDGPWAQVPPGSGPGGAPQIGDTGLQIFGAIDTASTIVESG